MEFQIPLYLLPRDFVEEEILSRLPVKSLLRFRCVSKSWRSLIDSEDFIGTHLRNSSKNTAFPHQRVVLTCHEGIKQCSLQSMLDPFTSPATFDDPIIDQLNDPTILGCCNGLVCILDVDTNFFLWNPSIRIFKKLPKMSEISSSHGYILNYGFGWDERSDDYKVFAFVHMLGTGALLGKVYSSKTNTWKTVDRVCLPLIREEGIFVGGKLHWKGYGVEANIACFNLKTEECGKMELPFKLEHSFSYSMVGLIGGCLSSVKFYYDNPIEVWVMKEYGVEESWSKHVIIAHGKELVERPFSSSVTWNGEVLLFFGRIFFVYCLRNYEFRRVRLCNSLSKENICVESLIWPEFEGRKDVICQLL